MEACLIENEDNDIRDVCFELGVAELDIDARNDEEDFNESIKFDEKDRICRYDSDSLIDGHSKLNRSLFREDADYALLISIEKVDEKTGTAEKTDVFSKRTIKPYQKVTHCNSVMDALNVCKSERGVVDLRVIEHLTGKTYDEVVEELGDKIYRNPAKCALDEGNPYCGWEDASEYLSGNVRKKLQQAELAAKVDEQYRKNVEALQLAQPAPLTANDISVKIGVSWIDVKYYKTGHFR